VKSRLTGDQVQFTMGTVGNTALIFPNDHTLDLFGTCNITTASGSSPGSCFSAATELTQPNSGNSFFLDFFGTTVIFAEGPVVSGGMQID
jgi:hypothetical protein